MKALLTLLCCTFVCALHAADVHSYKDIEFANVDGHALKLDLFVPDVKNPPLVVWIHGGGWRNGSKERLHASFLPEDKYAVASISYRLTDQAIFPAQIHDCKGAIRWLRAHAEKYGYSVDRIAVAGSSAGGHLAALVGVTGDMKALEGNVGGHLDQSSRVDAVVDFYGPTDFIMRAKNQPHKAVVEGSPVNLLLGGPANKKTDLAKLASPAFHVTKDDAPLLIIHGDQDNKVLIGQSLRIKEAYEDAGLSVHLEIVQGGGHGGKQYFASPLREQMVDFLDKHLRSKD